MMSLLFGQTHTRARERERARRTHSSDEFLFSLSLFANKKKMRTAAAADVLLVILLLQLLPSLAAFVDAAAADASAGGGFTERGYDDGSHDWSKDNIHTWAPVEPGYYCNVSAYHSVYDTKGTIALYVGWYPSYNDPCLTTNSNIKEVSWIHGAGYTWAGCRSGMPVFADYCIDSSGTMFNNCHAGTRAVIIWNNSAAPQTSGCYATAIVGTGTAQCATDEHNNKYFHASGIYC